MGKGKIQLPLPPSKLASEIFFSVIFEFCNSATLNFSDFNLHFWRNFWPSFKNAASTQTLLHLGWKRGINAKNCQKMSQINADARKEDLSCWEFFSVLKSFIPSLSTNLQCFKPSIYGSGDHWGVNRWKLDHTQ